MSYPTTIQRPITFIHISDAVPVALAAPMAVDKREHYQSRNSRMDRRDQSIVTNWIMVRGQFANRLRGISSGIAPRQSDRAIQLVEV